ncbi:MAG TPA: alpha/beta fold hydrolase [Candidatus Binatia bacterium]|nr:alpha/beta fold hydrolase [Candidatus Binatia bacterium]
MQSYWEAMLGASVKYYDVGGVHTRVLEAGTGTPIVALHGAGGHAENFVFSVVPLAQAGHIYALDMLGHGLNSRPTANYTIEGMLQHVEAFIAGLGVKRVTLMGLSLGSLLASWIAIRKNVDVARLVVTTTFGYNTTGKSDEQLTADFGRVRDSNKTALANTDFETIRKRMTPLVHTPELITDEMIGVRQHIYRLPGAAETMGSVVDDLFARRNEIALTPERLRRIDADAFVIWGRHNPTPVEEAEAAVKAMPHASLLVLEKSGHWPHVEEMDAYNAALLKYLTGTLAAH